MSTTHYYILHCHCSNIHYSHHSRTSFLGFDTCCYQECRSSTYQVLYFFVVVLKASLHMLSQSIFLAPLILLTCRDYLLPLDCHEESDLYHCFYNQVRNHNVLHIRHNSPHQQESFSDDHCPL